MILAALLTPADFGLVAISNLVIALAQIVVQLGLGQTVIQRRTQVEEAASTALWVSLLLSGVLYLSLWVAAPSLAAAYKNAHVVDVIRVAALALPLSSLFAIPSALLRRNMEFRRLFWINSSVLVVSALASVILAVLGAGVWALILGPMVGMTISTALAWRLSSWRPTFKIHGLVLRSMLGFSSWVMVAGFLNWMFLYAGSTIGGLFLGVEGLGVFSLGFTIAIVIPSFLVAAIGDVTYPTFCKMQENPRDIGEDLAKVQSLAGAVLFPVTLGISAIAPLVVHLLYGSKWAGLGTVISVLVIMPGLGHVWSLNETAYQAIGRPDLWTKVSGLSLLVMLPVLWLMGHRGLVAFTLGRFGAGWILPLGNIYLTARILKVGVRGQLKAFGPPLLISLGMFVVVVLLVRLGSTFEGVIGWIKLLAIVVFGGTTYLVLARIFQRELWDQMFLSLRRVFS
jgi:PST family polysaccharide transporter